MSEQPGLLGERHPQAEAGHQDRRPGDPQGDLFGLILDCVAQASGHNW